MGTSDRGVCGWGEVADGGEANGRFRFLMAEGEDDVVPAECCFRQTSPSFSPSSFGFVSSSSSCAILKLHTLYRFSASALNVANCCG